MSKSMRHLLQFKNNHLIVGLSYEAIDAGDTVSAGDLDIQGLVRVSHGAATNLGSGTHPIYIMCFDLSGCNKRGESIRTIVSEVILDFTKVIDRFHRHTYEMYEHAAVPAGNEPEFEAFVKSRRVLYEDVNRFLTTHLTVITSFVATGIKL
jgi:hypothetical protein